MKKILTIIGSLLLGLLIIGGSLYSLSTFKPQAIPSGLSNESLFQEKFEDKIYTNIEDFLSKVLPKSSFMISVHTELPDKEISEAIQVTPEKVTRTAEDKMEGDLDAFMSARPSSKSIRLLDKHGLKLPGLVASTQTEVVQSLPGFPMQSGKKDGDAKADANSQIQDDKKMITFTESQEDVYYNQEKKQIVTSDTTVTKLTVSIVIDDYTFNKNKLDIEKVTELIKGVASINMTRGDAFSIELTEFQTPLHKFQRFLDKQKEPFAKFIDQILKINWILVILILALLALIYAAIPRLRKIRKAREQKRLEREEEDRLKKQEALLEQEKRKQVFKEKRSELASISQAKPEMIAHHIMGWIKSENESDTEEEVQEDE